MTEPNFFILGAPKCGTTSMATWLSQHPNIYMSPWKEPKYFDRDLKTRFRLSREAYLTLFDNAGEQHHAVGEATVWYLYSREAVPAIERELPGARYIVMLRNPVDMAYALHEQCTSSGNEHVRDFDKAWRLSPLRRKGLVARPWLVEPRRLDYQAVCSLGDQMRRLFGSIHRERVLTLILDDLRADPSREYRRVLQFLNVPDDGRRDFPVHNPAKRVRWQAAQPLLAAAKKGERIVRSRLGLPAAHSQFLQDLGMKNRVARPRPPMAPELRAELQEFFAPDIALLSDILQRGLSHWLADPAG